MADQVVPWNEPDNPWPYTADGLLDHADPEAMDPRSWQITTHPDYVAAMANHRDGSERGRQRTLDMLARRGWMQVAKLGPASEPYVIGWSSEHLAYDHEPSHGWLSPAHVGVVVRMTSGEPTIPCHDPRFAGMRLRSLVARPMTFRAIPLSNRRDGRVRFVAEPVQSEVLFGDQTPAVRRRLARMIPPEHAGPLWRPVLEAHFAGTAVPPLPLPSLPRTVWLDAVERMLACGGKGTTAEPDIHGRLSAIARALHREAEWAMDHRPRLIMTADARNHAIDVLVDGGHDAEADVLRRQRRMRDPVEPDMEMVDVYAALAEEAEALARSVTAYHGRLIQRR